MPYRLAKWTFVGLLLASACVSVDTIRGPDGTEWMVARCHGSMEACWRAASKECPAGYVAGDRAVGTSAVAITDDWVISKNEFLFRCKTQGSGDTVSDREAHEEHGSAETERVDLTTCRTVYSHFDEIAAMRRSAAPNRGARPRPSSIQFIATCRELPDSVQTCLVPSYYKDHGDGCDAEFARLKRAQLAKLDALFFDDDAEPAPAVKPAKAPGYEL